MSKLFPTVTTGLANIKALTKILAWMVLDQAKDPLGVHIIKLYCDKYKAVLPYPAGLRKRGDGVIPSLELKCPLLCLFSIAVRKS